MYKYHIIVAHDDNTIYRVFGCGTKKEVQHLVFQWADSTFIVMVVSDDCFKFSDNILVKKARNRK